MFETLKLIYFSTRSHEYDTHSLYFDTYLCNIDSQLHGLTGRYHRMSIHSAQTCLLCLNTRCQYCLPAQATAGYGWNQRCSFEVDHSIAFIWHQ